jgi:hypothetical protein
MSPVATPDVESVLPAEFEVWLTEEWGALPADAIEPLRDSFRLIGAVPGVPALNPAGAGELVQLYIRWLGRGYDGIARSHVGGASYSVVFQAVDDTGRRARGIAPDVSFTVDDKLTAHPPVDPPGSPAIRWYHVAPAGTVTTVPPGEQP